METKENQITDDTPIYRYMSLVRFIQLLETGFFVSSANNFEDEYDCMIPRKNELNDESTLCWEKFLKDLEKLREKKKAELVTPPVEPQYMDIILPEIRRLVRDAVEDYRKRFGMAKRSVITEKWMEEFIEKLSVFVSPLKSDGIQEDSEEMRKQGEAKVAKDLFRILEQEGRKSILISCWSRSSEESYLMWKGYAEKGVRIGSTVGKFKKIIENFKENSCKEFLSNLVAFEQCGRTRSWAVALHSCRAVEYTSQVDFKKNFDKDLKDVCADGLDIEWVFRKLAAYKEEEEIRFVIGAENQGESSRIWANNPAGLLLTSSDMAKNLIDNVLISPFFSDDEAEALMAFLSRYSSLDKKKISLSDLSIAK